MQNYQPDTLCIHAGYEPKDGEPRVVPIVQSTTFRYNSAAEMGALFNLEQDGYFYSRIANPTVDAVEKKIAALEGGVGCLLTSSGMAATLLAVLNICPAGSHVVCSNAVYGGTFNLFNKTMRDMGLDFTFVPPDVSEEALHAAMQPNTRAVFCETLANPSLAVADLALQAKVAHAHGVPLLVDNTFATPINCRPFAWGADIIVHSTTKYMDGHAVQVGGAVVDGGHFDWQNGKFPMLTAPDESYHGMVYTQRFGNAAYITKARTHLLRDIGCTPAPQNAFLLNLGLDTLALRMQRHCANAERIAAYLEQDPRVSWVNYPGLKSSPYYALAQKYLPHGSCGVISFGVKGGREAAARFMEKLRLASMEIHVAELRTSVLHPASTTHRQLTDQQLLDAGISADMIRLSVGIENAQDILADLDQALGK